MVITMSDRNKTGKLGEKLVADKLRLNGFRDVRLSADYRCPWDIQADGSYIEVKTSSFNKHRGLWLFNLHRHGEVSGFPVDAYVFVALLPAREKPLLMVIPPAEIGSDWNLSISITTLLWKWSRFINQWEYVRYGRGTEGGANDTQIRR
jgi:hypothetical protein